MATTRMLSAFLLIISVSLAEGAIRCGNLICQGVGVYCCEGHCCTSVWTFWWFWMIWVVLFSCLGSCGWWCGRRYRERRYQQASEYIIVSQPPQAYTAHQNNYGTVSAPPYTNQVPPYTAVDHKPQGYSGAPPPAYAS